jgi:arginine:ornithine antiporter/lysine permease
MSDKAKKLGLFALIALVISSSIGSGIFDLTRSLAESASAGPAIIAWVIVGLGMLLMVLSINYIVKEKPNLDGIVSYAEEGFGKFWGFASGWGYWLSAWLGNVAFGTVLMAAIGRLGGDTLYGKFFVGEDKTFSWLAVIIASIVMWLITYLVTRGIENASFINAVVMVAKLLPLAVFLIMAIVMFKAGVFSADFWSTLQKNAEGAITGVTRGSGLDLKAAWPQIQACFMVLIWVFVGVEGATVFTSRAHKKSDAAKASVVGFLALIGIYLLISLLPYGLVPYEKLAQVGTPAVGEILKMKGMGWGVYLMNGGLAISILGAWLSWTLLPVETTTILADHKLLPPIFGKLNRNGAPTFALVVTTILSQLFIFTLPYPNLKIGGVGAYDFAFSLCSSAILLSWMFIGFYAAKLAIQKSNIGIAIIGLIAGAFQVAMMYLAGWQYFLLVLLGFLPGIALFWFARNKVQDETGEEAMTTVDTVSAVVVAIAGVVTIALLLMGRIAL